MTVKPYLTLILALALRNTYFTSIASNVSFSYGKKQIMETTDLQIQSDVSTQIVYCSSVIENGLTWPQTLQGKETVSLQYCLDTNCSRITRTCNADGTWAPITDICDIKEESSVTALLSEALDQKEFLNIWEISKNYVLFKALDVFLINQVLKLSCGGYVKDGGTCADIFDNVLKIDKDVLMESQLELCRSMYALLDNLNHYFSQISQIRTNFATLTLNNFVYLSYGIILLKGENELTIAPIENGILEEVMATENFEGAIMINSYIDLMTAVYNTVYTVFFNDRLFQDEFRQSSDTTSKIFGKVEIFEMQQMYPVHIIYSSDDNTFTNNVTCMIWNTTDQRGFWSYGGQFHIFKSCFICSFWNGQNYAFSFTPPKDVTDTLTEILSSNSNSSEILSRLLQASSRYEEFNPLNIFLVGEILKKVNENDLQFLKITDGYNDLELLSRIVTFLQKIDKGVLSESQNLYNATDSVLFYIDLIIKKQEYQSNLQLMVSENFIILTIWMNTTDFAGFVLLDNNQVEILNSSVNDITELLQYENLDSAFILSPELKSQMDEDAVIIINIFFEDVFFNEKNHHLKYANVSKIYDVILPENITFSGPISLIYNNKNSHGLCSHWFYNFPEKVSGFWQNDSEGEDLSSLVQCDFWHTTHFALLLLDDNAKYEEEDSSLSWITNITLSLSLFGFFSILLTASLFSTWRNKTGNKILLNFVFSGISQIVIFFLAADYNKKGKIYCVFTGAILHFLVLSQFCWMMNIAVLQFRRFVTVLGSYPRHILLKTCLFAWGFPLIPVISVLAVNYNLYVSGSSGLCYPSGTALYLGVWLPICAIIFINCVIFLYVMHSILYKKAQNVSFGGNESIYHWRLVIFLFFLLGLAWVFGFLAELDDGMVFVYLFDLLATLQGFVMFLFFILLNKNVRDLYRQKLQSCSGKSK